MIFKRVDHVEIVPRNPEETIEFYVNVLGFKIKSRHEVKVPPMKEVIYLELGDTVIEIISVTNPKSKSENPWEVGYRGIALEVENVKKSCQVSEGQRSIDGAGACRFGRFIPWRDKRP